MPRDAFGGQVSDLKSRLVSMGTDVGRTIADGVSALTTGDRALAQAIIEHDAEINRLRYDLEEQCYELIATQQPLASDLRDIISILLIAIELERIADHSKNLAEIVIHLGNAPLYRTAAEIPRIAELVQSMLDQSLDAFSRRDAVMARAVCNRDDEIDQLYQRVFRDLLDYVTEDPRTVSRALNLLFAAHNLERIGDRVTNIGERIIYAATGQLEELNVDRQVS
ncbi:MAG: phosphate signaling complex protein PhoU [Chloroflexi bacterium]|nr:phosphate signaling complex protein PhoU [Chloroflexota bacterium]